MLERAAYSIIWMEFSMDDGSTAGHHDDKWALVSGKGKVLPKSGREIKEIKGFCNVVGAWGSLQRP